MMSTRPQFQTAEMPTIGHRRSSSRRRRSNSTHNRKLSENLRALYKDFNQYQDAIELVKPKVLSNNGHLSTDDRTALAFAYKQMLKGLRDQLDSTTQPGGAQTTSVLTNEISRVCNEVIDLLRQWLIPAATAGEESVFYWKMFADFHRYLWETPSDSGSSSEDHANAAFQAYKLACLHANQHLSPTHRGRLGLALNFSVFYHQVLNSPERACHLAKFAFDEAVGYGHEHPGEMSDEAVGIMQIMQDHLMVWQNETP